MHWIDWVIVCLPPLIACLIACRMQRYVKSVADFPAAGHPAATGHQLLAPAIRAALDQPP